MELREIETFGEPGAVVHLARREHIKQIIQVTFLRLGRRPPLQTIHGEVEIAQEVWAHFREVKSIEHLGRSTNLTIETITRPFDSEPREKYVSWVRTHLRSNRENKIVLLDPDTGIEPQTANRKHVKVTEVQALI